jgi:hypothetical protein
VKEPSRRTSLAWAVSAALALASHYFAIFLVLPEAVLLLRTQRRRSLASVTFVGLVAVALVPLAWYQQYGASYGFEHRSLLTRVIQIPKQFMVGYGAPARNVLAFLATILVVVSLYLLVRHASRREQGAAVPLGSIALAGVVIPVVLSAIGLDYLSTRNLVAALVPFIVVVGAGFSVSRIGVLSAVAFVAVSLMAVVAVIEDRNLQRTDWRGAVKAVRVSDHNRAIAVIGSNGRFSPILLYAPKLRVMDRAGVAVNDVGLISTTGGDLRLPPPFFLVRRGRVQQLTVELFQAEREVLVTPASLRRSYRGGSDPAARLRVLFEERPQSDGRTRPAPRPASALGGDAVAAHERAADRVDLDVGPPALRAAVLAVSR